MLLQRHPRICETCKAAQGRLRGTIKNCLITAGIATGLNFGGVMRLSWLGRCGLWAAAAGAIVFSMPVQAQSQSGFPFGSELRMDARPLKGSKRVPYVEIAPNGTATIDMWCDSVQSQFVIAADTVTVLIGQKTQRPCTPEQTKADGELLDALQQATNWKREGDGVVLIGARQLKFRPSTN